MTAQDEELKRLAEAAAPGDWEYREECLTGGVFAGRDMVFGGDYCEGWLAPDDPNVKFVIGAQPSAILAMLARLEAAERDADLYRWLREQKWYEAEIFVVAGTKSQVRLGTDCPSGERLDAMIAAERAKGRP